MMCTYGAIGQELVVEGPYLARAIAEAASDALATNIQVLDIQDLTTIAEFFVIASADNVRQLRAIGEGIEEDLREKGVRPLRREGTPETGWLVLDYGSVIVHLFTVEQREHYRLEDLWAEAQRLLVIQ
jgi:ribosome-associated protein